MLELFITALFIVVILLISVWLAIVLALEDFSVSTVHNLPFTNILAIFPHPDDETFTSGGLIHKLSQQGKKTSLLLLTKGEKGTDDAHTEIKLKKIRSQEAKKSAKILGYHALIHDDLGDGELSNKKTKVQRKIQDVMKKLKPDLVITFDRAGVYGHPDHMVVSQIATELVKKSFPKTTLWYTSIPSTTYNAMHLPTHMAKNKSFAKLRSQPTHKIWIGGNIFAKLRSLYAHISQLPAFKRSVYLPFLPLWFQHSARLFEYFHTAYTPKKQK